MDAEVDVPEISTGCWEKLGKGPGDVMCASARMVVKRQGAERPAVLVLSKANGFVHVDALPAGEAMLRRIADKRGWDIFEQVCDKLPALKTILPNQALNLFESRSLLVLIHHPNDRFRNLRPSEHFRGSIRPLVGRQAQIACQEW